MDTKLFCLIIILSGSMQHLFGQTDSTKSDSLMQIQIQNDLAASQVTQPQQRVSVSANPDIGVIGDFRGMYHSYGIKNFDAYLSEAEFSFKSVVDPYARADFYYSVSQDPVSGEFSGEIEEGFVTTTSLPAHLQLKAGRFKQMLGRVNTVHSHALQFINTPDAIVNYFGADQVQVGDKAIKIHSNTVRVDADVVAHTVHRRFSADRKFVEGVALVTKEGKTVYNWPQQDYDNGVSKNERTSKRYKAVVRILKNLRVEMLENGYSKAEKARSYLIACLAWNVPDYFFEEESYTKMIEDCLSYLVERTSALENVNEWGEVNELKYLFRPQQGWKFDEVHDFLVEALSYFRKLK